MTTTSPRTSQRAAVARRAELLPGLAVVALLAAGATAVGHAVPVLGGPVTGIVAGVALSSTLGRRARLAAGLHLAVARVLPVAVVVLGAQLSLRQVVRVGVGSLPVMLGTLAVCLALAQVVGRRLGVDRDLRTLIGVGTGICGASAIATISPVIRARGHDVAYAVSTIFAFNIAAVLTFPLLGHALGLGQHSFGLFAGTAVNDTSSVVAAAASYGSTAANYAVVVKLTRTLMIIPISIGLAALVRRREPAAPGRPTGARGITLAALQLVPWFLVGFLVLAGANSAGLISAGARPALAQVAALLITVALTAIGLSTDAGALRRTGHRPLLLGLVLWVAVGVTSLSLQALTTGL